LVSTDLTVHPATLHIRADLAPSFLASDHAAAMTRAVANTTPPAARAWTEGGDR
jgi:hypothetical protein